MNPQVPINFISNKLRVLVTSAILVLEDIVCVKTFEGEKFLQFSWILINCDTITKFSSLIPRFTIETKWHR